MKRSRWISLKTMAALGMTTAIAITAVPKGQAVVHAEQAVVSTSTGLYGTVTAPAAKPLWSVPLTKFDQYGTSVTTAIAEEGRVFALIADGQLAAYDGPSGRKLWKYGAGLKPLLTYNQGVVYGLTKDGSIYAVGTDGSKKWTAAIHADKAVSINPVGDTIYVTQDLTLFALDRATGKLRWKTAETEAMYEAGLTDVTETDGIVLRTYMVQGALSSTQINAYDKKTGKQLWTRFHQNSPLAVKDGVVYSVVDVSMPSDDVPFHRNLSIAVLNLKTGALKGTRVYEWTIAPDSPGRYSYGGANGSAFLDGSDLYIYQDQAVAKYDFNAYAAGGKPVQRWSAPNAADFQPLYKAHNGRLLYQNSNTHNFAVLKLANGQISGFPNGIQPVQTDLYGNGLFVARADGTLDAYDFAAFKPAFSVKTGSGSFEPTLKSGNMIFIRSGGSLYAVKLPANLATG
ncbi:PQQ-like beta-propeller repeat protein [Paenibacillus rhizovicinus]|uniref:PQQ-like beta-propeller repeat protein n=1 Tax=Paenibacillus rhizovicinus TaxID=2704463 RepID=A0A6C0P229_9BACL|nr:PQQ-binding-like beta-propeller repeat protein [Paenibacillus rhizovicinus]QHW32411.1 PQQ-like beta-propeller repeat protein [Paenibacillus rhizovicinus]